MKQKHITSFQEATGPVDFRLTNDYIFKRLLEKNEDVLRELIRALLHLNEGDITHLQILNPIMPGDTITDRGIVLDVNVEINHDSRIDLEMQVVNEHDWPERSLYYACRNYLNLVRGVDYDKVAPSWQIGFLDYTLFHEHPSFYATYKLMDTKDSFVYTDKFSIGVVDLTKTGLATDEDRLYNIDKWAKLFKSETWEDIRMLAKQDVFISKAGETYFEITADEHERQLAEAREDALRRERARKRRFAQVRKELEEANSTIATLTADNSALAADNSTLAADNSALTAEIERLRAELEKLKA